MQAELINDLINELNVETSYRGIERLVQLIIQGLLDLGSMVVAGLGRRLERYSDIGPLLRELGMLDEDDAKLLRAMAGLRNILVHMYASVDRSKVLEASKTLAVDAKRISESILEKVRSKGLDPKEGGVQHGKIVERLRDVLAGRVRLAYLFGGRCKGYALKRDYDIAVLMPENYTLFDLGLLQVDVARALGVEEEAVDLFCLNDAPPRLVLEALDCIPIVKDPIEAFELRLKALREILDLEAIHLGSSHA